MSDSPQPSHTSDPSTADSPAVDYEAILTPIVSLASLFRKCVEALDLIQPAHKRQKEEQLLISRLGIEHARLLVWGDIVGICSPSSSVTDRAVPLHPSPSYPDLKEPTFFGPRDPRLDDADAVFRKGIEESLRTIVDKLHSDREDMARRSGICVPKKLVRDNMTPLDANRLESFRERFELLRQVARSYADMAVPRRTSMVGTTGWQIADAVGFRQFLDLVSHHVDWLITSMHLTDRVDRAIRVDIRTLGWHLTQDRSRLAVDVNKLRLIQQNCRDRYPDYFQAAQMALDNMDRQRRDSQGSLGAPTLLPVSEPSPEEAVAPTDGVHESPKPKRAGLMGMLRSFNRRKSVAGKSMLQLQSRSDSAPGKTNSESANGVVGVQPKSVAGMPDATENGDDDDDDEPARSESVIPVRSKSIGEILNFQTDDEEATTVLRRADTSATVESEESIRETATLGSGISRHDQFMRVQSQAMRAA